VRVTLSPKRQRILALALLAAAILVVLQFVLMPFLASSRLHGERVSMLRSQLQAVEALIAARPALEKGAAALEGDKVLQTLTLSAESAAIGGAQLQGQLTAILTDAAASVSSAQLLPEEKVGPLTRVRLQMVAETDMQGLVRVLHAIGGARPLLVIERLSVRDPDGVFAMKPETVVVNRLQVEMVVSAHMRVP
jgi:hypothetical protein